MAGRGCTITVKVLDSGSNNNGKHESDDDLSLPVALHSPLEVLKQQLVEIIGIPIQDQVLILCNLNDPDRNSDILLTGRDFMTLHSCGIKNGSVLTLHALGLSSELKQKLMKEALLKKIDNNINENKNNKIIHTLTTHITAAKANHSYNGVIFDIQGIGPYEINVLSISIGGMLGRIRVFARDRPWSADTISPASTQWWAHQESPSRIGWELIADKFVSVIFSPAQISSANLIKSLLKLSNAGVFLFKELLPEDELLSIGSVILKVSLMITNNMIIVHSSIN
jgi:hypothetical protein